MFEDGSYSCSKGVALIAKVLAGKCKMNYTRAAVGKGTIPEGKNPKTMTQPADYVMEAKIAAVTNPVNGECQVTVQINSSDVEKGFFVTGILLYAQDPDEGEIPYTYLMLENGPEWIRPSSSVVGKLATFEIIAAVGDVDTVTATIDSDTIVTKTVVEKMIAESMVQRDIVIPTTAWTEEIAEGGGGGVCANVVQKDVTDEMIPIVSIFRECMSVTRNCGMSTTVETVNGGVKFYAEKTPEQDIGASLLLLRASGGSGTYINNMASDEEVQEMLNEVFGSKTDENVEEQ